MYVQGPNLLMSEACRRALVPPWHDNDLTDEGPNERPAVALLAANFEHRGCETLLGDRLGRLLDRHAFGHLLVRHAPNDAEAVRSSLEEAGRAAGLFVKVIFQEVSPEDRGILLAVLGELQTGCGSGIQLTARRTSPSLTSRCGL